jgi:hypothetical protein
VGSFILREGPLYHPLARFSSIFNRRERSGVLINFTEHSIQLGRVTGLREIPVTVDCLSEVSLIDEGAVNLWLKETFPSRTGSLAAYCGFHPPQRIISRESVNLRRIQEAAYLQGLVCDHAKIPEAAGWQVSMLHPSEGSSLSAEGAPRAGLLVGIPEEAAREIQARLLSWGVFPRRLELGTLPLLGGLARHLELNSYPNALVVCEISQNQTRVYFIGKDGVHTPAYLPHGLHSVEEIAIKELGAADVATARQHLCEQTESARAQGRRLVRVLARHLRPAVDYFEMQTGQRSGALFCAHLPSRLSWLGQALSASVDLELFIPDYATWLPAVGISVLDPATITSTWFQPLSLVAQLAPDESTS